MDSFNLIAKLPANFYEQLESKKWSERKEKLEELEKLLKDNPRLEPTGTYGELVSVLKKVIAKDSNINVVSVAGKCMAGLASGLRKKFGGYATMVTPVVLEKFKEKKPIVATAMVECIDAIAKTTTLDALTEELLGALDNKTPSVKIQTALFLSRYFAGSSPTVLNKKVLKTFCPSLIKLLTDSDVEVRESACVALGTAMKVVGEKTMAPFLQEVSNDHLKMDKIKVCCEKAELTVDVEDDAAGASKTANAGGGDAPDGAVGLGEASIEPEVDPWESLAPFDLMSKFPANFYEQLESKKWSERKEKLEELEKLLKDNPRLETNGMYGELVSVLKKVIAKDSNINVVSVAGKCMACLASGLRKKFGGYATMVTPAVLEKFKEKKPIVATAMVECIDAIAKTTTLEALTEELLGALDSKTPSVKVQTALFLSRYFAACSPAVLSKKVLKAFCPSLIKLLSDSDVDVRESASVVLGTAMKVVGEKTLTPFLEDVVNDHLKMDKIKACCDKAEVKVTIVSAGGDAPTAKPAGNKKTEPSKGAGSAKPPASVRPKQEPVADLDDDESAAGGEVPKKAAATAAKSRPSTAKGPRSASNTRKSVSTATKKKGEEESMEGGALIETKQKTQRFQEEKSLKVLKWQFNTPSEEHAAQLKNQLATVCKPFLHVQMFHSDFKQHLKALDALTASIEQCPDALIGALDLLLKWCTLRFFDTNPSVLLKCLSFIKASLNLCHDRGVELHDIEIISFVPFLLLKAGEPKDTVRTEVRKIVDQLCKLYPASKLFPFIMDGCKSKNARQRSECLEQIAMLIEVFGISVCGQPASASLKVIAQCVGDRDNAVRNAALNAIVAAFFHLGERVFNMVGNMNSKEFAMLEERIKRTTKNRPVVVKPSPDKAVERPRTGGATVTKPTVRPQRNSSPPPSRSSMKYAENNGDASPETQSHQRQTPATVTRGGKFQLEMEKLGLSMNENMEDCKMPELHDHQDVEEVMASPMQIPQLRFRPPSTSTTPQRREVITQSMDASTALDTAINSITSNKIDVATQAIAQLDEIIKDATKVNLLTDKVDQLLMAVYFQFRMAFNTHMTDDNVSSEDVMRLYRHLCVVLLSMLAAGDLVREASDGTLKDLLCQMLTVLLDERLEKIVEGDQIIRSLNVMVVKLVAKSDPTACLVALIRLLRDTLHSQTSSSKFLELVLRCLWKLSRNLNETSDIKLGRVLAEANAFFIDFPAASWKQKPNDTPLRTVRTILHKLAEIYGDRVLDFVDVIDKPESSEVVACLKRNLRELNKNPTNTAHGTSNGASSATTDASMVESKIGGAGVHNGELNEIFKKIGSKEKSKEGLCELYDFKQRNPQVDIGPFLKKSSEFFRNYITRGLEQVENERRTRVSATSSNVQILPGGGGESASLANNISGSESSAYLEKLQKLRATCGLEPLRIDHNRKTDEDPEMLLPQLRVAPMDLEQEGAGDGDAASAQPRLTADEVNEYKARLQRLKRGF